MAEEKTIGEQANIIGAAFESIIKKKFGSKIAPPPQFFSSGIKHLDAILGGGIVSSGPVMISSTPETGKSTFAYQMAKQMHDTYENSITVYLDIEGSGGTTETTGNRVSRIDSFGLGNTTRFSYQAIVLNVMELFEVVQELIETKIAVETKTGREFILFIIWDSVASTPSSKTDEASDPNKIIGLKGRQLSFLLDKYLSLFKFNRVFFMCIDQVRADIQIAGPFVQKEQSVGAFKDMKSASNIFALQHTVQQWLFLSRTKTITRDSHYGLDGWLINIMTEKNKCAPSKNYVTCVFDKYSGLDTFWSHFLFLSEMTYTEKKILKTDNKLSFPLLITTSGQKATLKVVDKKRNVLYTSEPFFRKNAKKMYQENEEFKKWFDYGVDLSCYERITNGMFKIDQTLQEELDQQHDVPELNQIDLDLDNQLNSNSEQDEFVENKELSEEEIQQKIYEETLLEQKTKNTEYSPVIPPEEVNIPEGEDYKSAFDD